MRLFFSFLLLCMVACAPVPDGKPAPTEMQKNPFLSDPLYCNTDADCTCGGIDKSTGECFIGNQLYASKFVDFSQSCPDFCAGIVGNLQTKCVANRCQSVPGTPRQEPEPIACTMDAKQCPDGSFVSRVGPNCEFAPCPSEQETEPKENWTQASCEAQGGSWERRYAGYICNFPASDARKPCTDSSQCEGSCMATPQSGACSEMVTVYGCVKVMQGGEVMELCID